MTATMTTKLTPLVLAITSMALFAACAPLDQRGVSTTSPSRAGIGPTTPAPTPSSRTLGAEDAPSFGPGVGAGLNTGIGIQPSMNLIP